MLDEASLGHDLPAPADLAALRASGITHYSPTIRGNGANHHRAVRFDWTDGYIGITEMPNETGGPLERVLLNPAQWAALVAFVQKQEARR